MPASPERGVERRILGAVLTVGALTAGVKLFGVARQLVVAHVFGTSDGLESFLIALLLPSYAVTVVARSFSAALIPTFIRVREDRGGAAADALLRVCLLWALVLLLAIALLLALSSGALLPLLASGFSAEKLAQTQTLLWPLLAWPVLAGLATIYGAVLNAGERFALVALVPAATPIAVIAVLLLAADRYGVTGMTWAVVAGAGIEALLLAVGLWRRGQSPLPAFRLGAVPGASEVRTQLGPLVGGALLMSSTTLIDQAMAATLGPGSVASLAYGGRLVTLVLSVGTMAMGTAVIPHFSRLLARDEHAVLGRALRRGVVLIVVVSVPVALLGALLSDTIVRLVFEHGAFTAGDSAVVGRVQALYLLQLPAYTLGILFARLLTAQRRNNLLLVTSAMNLVTNVALNWLLMQWLGLEGIALSTTCVYCLSTMLLAAFSMPALRR